MPLTRELVDRSVSSIGAGGAAVAVLTEDARGRNLVHATDDAASRIDELQFTIGEGPCLDAYRSGTPMLHSDITAASSGGKWPTFASEVIGELDVHSLFAFPFGLGDTRLGVLELYRRRSDPFSAAECACVMEITAQLGSVVVAEYTADLDNRFGPTAADIEDTHYGRDDVDIAVGILAVRHAMSLVDAAARLRAAAYAQSKPIGSLAHDIVHDSARFVI